MEIPPQRKGAGAVREDTFGGQLLASFNATHGPIGAILGIAIGVAAWFFVPSGWQTKVLIIGSLFFLWVFFVLLHAARTAYYATGSILPRVRFAGPPDASQRGAVALLLLDASPLFSHGTTVSVYLS